MEEAAIERSNEIEWSGNEQAHRREENQHQTCRGHLVIMEEVYTRFTGRNMANFDINSNSQFGTPIAGLRGFRGQTNLIVSIATLQ